MAFSAQVTLSLLAHETESSSLSSGIRVTPASYAQALADGSAANQAQVAWSANRTLAAASQNLSLSTLSDVRGGATVTVTITAVKAWYMRNRGASSIAFAGSPFPAAIVSVETRPQDLAHLVGIRLVNPLKPISQNETGHRIVHIRTRLTHQLHRRFTTTELGKGHAKTSAQTSRTRLGIHMFLSVPLKWKSAAVVSLGRRGAPITSQAASAP